MEERLKKLMEMLPEELDGAILLAPVHRKYYLGIVSSAGSLIITREKCFFIDLIDAKPFISPHKCL